MAVIHIVSVIGADAPSRLRRAGRAPVIKVLLYYHVTDQRDYPVMAALCIFIVVGITALHLLKYRYIMIIYLMTVTTALALTIG